MKHLLFVYGTLKNGYWNNRLMWRDQDPPKLVSEEAKIFNLTLYGSNTGIPFAVKNSSDSSYITGEVWQIGNDALHLIDALEGHPTFYRRELLKTEEGLEVWVYLCSEQSVRGYPLLGTTWNGE